MTTVIFLHGRGMGPETAVSVAAAFPDTRLLAPAGGVALRRGHTWFENVRTGIARPESVAAAATRLLAWIADQGEIDAPWLAGFSNGGALAAHLLIHHPGRFAGAALFAAPLVLPPWPAGALRDRPLFYAHGDATDEVVDQDFYAAAEEYLRERSGGRCTIRHYPVGHTVSSGMVADCGRWFATLRAVIGQPLNPERVHDKGKV